MADRFQKKGPRARTFLRQWREYRKMSQDQLAEAMSAHAKGKGTTGVSVSRIERGLQPYSQDYLEVAALVLECTTTDLLSRDPRKDPGPIEQAIKLLEAARNQG